MWRSVLVGFLLSNLLLVSACDEEVELSAEQSSASLAWLELLDEGEYERSWFQYWVDNPG